MGAVAAARGQGLRDRAGDGAELVSRQIAGIESALGGRRKRDRGARIHPVRQIAGALSRALSMPSFALAADDGGVREAPGACRFCRVQTCTRPCSSPSSHKSSARVGSATRFLDTRLRPMRDFRSVIACRAAVRPLGSRTCVVLCGGPPRGARSRIAALSAAARAALRAPLCACGQRSWRRRLGCLDRPRDLASEVAVGAGPMPQVFAPVASDASHTAGGQGTDGAEAARRA